MPIADGAEASWSTIVANWRIGRGYVALALIAAALPFAVSRIAGGSRAEHDAHAQHQYRLADPDHQSDRGAADRSEYRRPHRTGIDTMPSGSTATTARSRRASIPTRRCLMRAIRRTSIRPAMPPIATATANARASRSPPATAAAAATSGGKQGTKGGSTPSGSQQTALNLAQRSPTSSWPRSTAR